MSKIVVKPPNIPEKTKREMALWFQRNCPEFFARKCEELRKKKEAEKNDVSQS
ncbi:hypothetical protein P4U05_17085 [Bacillus paranthracis]|uniref:hypothetical protein n=1 Tax=Bacillus phage phi4B1 TaxID=1643324 RepID=UPI000200F2A4|nr:hypothetical protein [Bacillus paranthracis]YP_009206336.1 hypothetical protein XO26_0037 [Bacillus phage phi4B1]ADY20329.1 hypothetical protein YBT020_05415 [Bacillus thuringiensis serovar finitimus YBT-020]MRC72825.1 hypothetical protein [Bacillus thuringiensis]ALF02554.1 hypothetical protein XO26_0037 [Bacillus phage phi4B1]MCR6799392.1 hypothetical protein [Bacillus paranthracis]MEC3358448.1 hypothetical protein [Bacillus paranthracis]